MNASTGADQNIEQQIEQLILAAGYSWRGLEELAKEASEDIVALISKQTQEELKKILDNTTGNPDTQYQYVKNRLAEVNGLIGNEPLASTDVAKKPSGPKDKDHE